jgi:hypothetical protein
MIDDDEPLQMTVDRAMQLIDPFLSSLDRD